MNKVERLFKGTDTLEKALIFVLNGQIDKIAVAAYDGDKANTSPSCLGKEGSVN
ncbi:hypothetical protein [Brevibacillus parabrevis]|uniref:hypothetical protein n=1 Tax=Brevibacillus parabrevis TaxID=54914 RepID=UPI0028D825D3|nr:hypothetical protein [Brevibacillus parabrevis]